MKNTLFSFEALLESLEKGLEQQQLKNELNNLPVLPPIPTYDIPVGPGAFVLWSVPWLRRRYQTIVEDEQRRYEIKLAEYEIIELERKNKTDEITAKINAYHVKISASKNNVMNFKAKFEKCEPDTIVAYFTIVLRDSLKYPDGFPKTAKILYIPASKQLVVEYTLPEMEKVIPTIKSYKYVKAGNSITKAARLESQRRSLYTSVIAQTTLRSIWELFTSDKKDFVETIVFNGYVDTIDTGTGRRIRPCVVTIRTTKDTFSSLDLRYVDPIACLRTLNASFSKSPAELAPVRPILELNMTDSRFIQETDVLSKLDERSNLMDLTPGEFESLITNLFQKMGLNTKLTQASRDGGVDCVAFDPRPIFGGKVVIQAKRYKNTVGVSSVRDLFGTMQNEGASKGILVTTSGYGKAAFEFANGKPIELLDGGNLLYLLKEHADIDAKIVMPDEWQDAPLDNGL